MSEYFKLKGSEVQSIDTICYLAVDLVSYVLYGTCILYLNGKSFISICCHYLMFYGANVGENAALIDLNTSLRIHNYMFSEGLL